MEDLRQTGSSPQTELPKFSRYRSVRRAAEQESQPISPPLPVRQVITAPSRYHRKPQDQTQVPIQVRSVTHPLVRGDVRTKEDAASSNNAGQARYATHGNAEIRGQRDVVQRDVGQREHTFQGGPVQEPRSRYESHERKTSKTASNVYQSSSSPKSYIDAREEARMILEGEFDRLQQIKKRQAHERREYHAEVPDLNRRNRPKEEVPNPPSRNGSRDVIVPGSKPKPEKSSPPSDSKRLFSLRQNQSPKKESRQSTSEASKEVQNSRDQHQRVRSNVRQSTPPATMTDAPISAVNAGDRRVEVRYHNTTITLPVTPTTTVKDLLNSASICMSDSVDPRSAILLEAFSQLDLERPLRRYERIRDVMNSWDNDTQNYLFIMSDSECEATGIELRDAPNHQPPSITLQMYHSSRPGKWDKRWVKLREDGQVCVSKHENDADNINVCHLSDFDLYYPSRKQFKKFKPPKKICFAVKSLQKSAVFLEGANFVHLFSSNEKTVMDQWYQALQSWRSWYLVSVLGEGQKPIDANVAHVDQTKRPETSNSNETIPYQLGSFKPLLDFSDFRRSIDSTTDSRTKPAFPKPLLDFSSERNSLDLGPGIGSRHSRQIPPSSFPARLRLDSVDPSEQPDNQAFTGTGLLARTASKRSQAGHTVGRGTTGVLLDSLDSSDQPENQAFTGTGLLARSASKRSQGGHNSGRGVLGVKGKPLVDLQLTSEFTDGSLLRKMEALHGTTEPKIERERRIEASIRVGEGF